MATGKPRCERSKLSIRMSVRRLTRLTNAFSKSGRTVLDDELYFCWYNFCRFTRRSVTRPQWKAGSLKRLDIEGFTYGVRQVKDVEDTRRVSSTGDTLRPL